ncbi:MAG: hypothetical protein ACI35O_06305 [Bacillaceae bacterium]
MLICKNHSVPIPTHILDSLYKKSGKTTKQGKHEGLGTTIIQGVVEKYKGFLDFVHKDEELLVKIKGISLYKSEEISLSLLQSNLYLLRCNSIYFFNFFSNGCC